MMSAFAADAEGSVAAGLQNALQQQLHRMGKVCRFRIAIAGERLFEQGGFAQRFQPGLRHDVRNATPIRFGAGLRDIPLAAQRLQGL